MSAESAYPKIPCQAQRAPLGWPLSSLSFRALVVGRRSWLRKVGLDVAKHKRTRDAPSLWESGSLIDGHMVGCLAFLSRDGIFVAPQPILDQHRLPFSQAPNTM